MYKLIRQYTFHHTSDTGNLNFHCTVLLYKKIIFKFLFCQNFYKCHSPRNASPKTIKHLGCLLEDLL